MHRQLFRNFLAPLRGPNDHTIRPQFLFVVREILDLEGAPAEEPMTERSIPCGYSGKGKLQGLAARYSDNPANGANESCAIEAGPCHGPWPGEVMDHAWQDFVQNLLGGSSALRLLRGHVLTLRRFDHIKILERKSLLFGETVGRTRRLADSVIGHRLRRTGHFVYVVGLFV